MDLSVLVVDDEENLLVLLDWILSKEGYQVKTTNNAYEALDFVEQEDIGVAILDINSIDGVDLLAEIKKRSPSTQVIIISDFPATGTKKCMKYDTMNYLTKPLDIPKLKNVIRHLAT